MKPKTRTVEELEKFDPQDIKWLREDYRLGRAYKELHPQYTDEEIELICADIHDAKPYDARNHGVYKQYVID